MNEILPKPKNYQNTTETLKIDQNTPKTKKITKLPHNLKND